MSFVRRGLLMILTVVFVLPAPPVAAHHRPIDSPLPTQPVVAPAGLVLGKVQIGPAEQEFVELYNPSSGIVDLTGWRLDFLTRRATAEQPPTRVLKQFGTVKLAPGEFYVLRHQQYIGLEADDVFESARRGGALAASGSVRLVDAAGHVVDLVGWNGAQQAETRPVPTRADTVVQRCRAQGVVRDSDDNAADFISDQPATLRHLIDCPLPNQPVPPEQPDVPSPSPRPEMPPAPEQPAGCQQVRLSEIYPRVGQAFIELHNPTAQPQSLVGCQLMSSRSRQPYRLGDREIPEQGYLAVSVDDQTVPLARRQGNVQLQDLTQNIVDETTYKGLTKDSSWSLLNGQWQRSYQPTPDRANHAMPLPSCAAGQTRHPATGRCRREQDGPSACRAGQYRDGTTGCCRRVAQRTSTGRIRSAGAQRQLIPCRPGYYRHPTSGRCRSISQVARRAGCPAGQQRNPLTGRCKKAHTVAALKSCPTGYQRHPETRRCRKVAAALSTQAGFAPAPVNQAAGATWGWWIVGGVSLLAVGYAGWQWRWEIGQFFRRLGAAFTVGKK